MLLQQQDSTRIRTEQMSWGWSRPTQGQGEKLANKQKNKHFSTISAFLEGRVCLCLLNSMAGSVSALEQHSGGKNQTGIDNSIPGIQMAVWESLRRHRTLSGVCLKVRRLAKVRYPYGKDGGTTVRDRWKHNRSLFLGNFQVPFMGSWRREMGMLPGHFGSGCCSLLPVHSVLKWYPSSHSPSALTFFSSSLLSYNWSVKIVYS